MFKDKSLIPLEVTRLAALGILAVTPREYGDLASEIRHFASRVAGPSLDLTAPPLELLRFEGLVASDSNMHEPLTDPSTELRLTESGQEELYRLLRAPVRAPLNDIGRLVIALKLRFLGLLPASEQCDQLDMLIEMAETEDARLADLQNSTAATESGASSPETIDLLTEWLEHDRAQAATRLVWFEDLRARLAQAAAAEERERSAV